MPLLPSLLSRHGVDRLTVDMNSYASSWHWNVEIEAKTDVAWENKAILGSRYDRYPTIALRARVLCPQVARCSGMLFCCCETLRKASESVLVTLAAA